MKPLLERVVAGLCVAIAVAWIGQAVFFVWRGRATFPGTDFLIVLNNIQGSGIWQALWIQIEGHRMIFPRLLLLADFYLVQGSNALVLTFVLAAYGVMILTIGRIAWPALSHRPVAAVVIAVLALGPYYDLLSEQAHAWTAVAYLFSFAALFSMWRGLKGERTDWRWLVSSGLFSLVGAFSGLGGVLAWPVMFWLAAARRHWPAMIVPLAAIVVFGIIFPIGEPSVHGIDDVVNLLLDPIHSMTALALHVGAVLGKALFVHPVSGYARAVAIGGGIAGILGASIFLFRLMYSPNRTAGAEGFIVGLMAFSVLWLSAAVGKHVQPGEQLVVQSRFNLHSGWFWMLFILAVMIELAPWRRLNWALAGVVLAGVAFVVPSAILSGLRADMRGSINQAAHASIIAGIDDPELRGTLNLISAEDRLWHKIKSDHVGPFARRPAIAAGDASAGECPSALILGAASVPRGVRLWGELPKGGDSVLMFDPQQKKIGAGLPWRPPLAPRVAPEFLRRANNASWWGYAESAGVSATLVVFDRNGKEVCRSQGRPDVG